MDAPTIVRPDQRLMKALWHAPISVVWVIGFQKLIGAVGQPDIVSAPTSAHVLFWAVLVAWSSAGVLIILNFLWITLGQYILEIQSGQLSIRTLIGNVPLYKAKNLDINKVRDVRVEERRYAGKGKVWFKYAIVCDYAGVKTTLISYLNKERANDLINGPLSHLASALPNNV